MECGPEIEVNGKRPEWLADDDSTHVTHRSEGQWFSDYLAKFIHCWGDIITIRLPASHWANDVIERGYWPWAGGDKAPDDWDGGEVLCRSGVTISAVDVDRWFHTSGLGDIIGYKREVDCMAFYGGKHHSENQSASEPDTNSMVGFNQIINDLKAELDSLGSKWADAIAKYPDLAPDPDRALKDEISNFCRENNWFSKSEAWNEPRTRACDLLYAWAKRHPAPVNKPCKLTPEELAQWRLEQARRIGAGALDIRSLQDFAKLIRDGNGDFYAPVQAALITLTEYNITPEMGK